MQRQWTIVNDADGSELANITADTEMRGAAISVAGVWPNADLVNRIATTLLQAEQWLRDQGAA